MLCWRFPIATKSFGRAPSLSSSFTFPHASNSRSILFSLTTRKALVFVGLILVWMATDRRIAGAQTSESKPAVIEEFWVTSIAVANGSDEVSDEASAEQRRQRVFAATATGLLLRPADVVELFGGPEGEGVISRPLYSHPFAVWKVAVSDQGTKLASTDYRGNLQVHEISSRETSMHEAIFERWTQAMTFAPGGEVIVAGNEAGKLFAWDGEGEPRAIELDKQSLTDIAFTSDGKRLAVSDGGGQVHFLTWPGLETVGSVKLSDDPIWCVAFASDGTGLFAGCGDRKLYRISLPSNWQDSTEVTDWPSDVVLESADWITRLAVAGDGSVAAGEVGGALHVLSPGKTGNSNSSTPVATAPSGIWALAWRDDAELLVGTRKHGVQAVKRSWSLGVPKIPAAIADADPQTLPVSTQDE